ncbi:MAG TPA: hypothetical protein VD969_28600 [Symbiobacteriaceae bacterium]|nr:hypothetical protein [Symbiobacteriaceae bacterium]
MRQRWRFSELLRGMAWGILLDLGAAVLFYLMSGLGSMAWVPALVWAMCALAVTGFSIAEERYLLTGGYWIVQLGLFTLFLSGYMKFLIMVSR